MNLKNLLESYEIELDSWFDDCGEGFLLLDYREKLQEKIFLLSKIEYDLLLKLDLKAIEIIKNERGRPFDPRLVDIFIKYHNEFDEIFKKNQEDNFSNPLNFKEK